MSDVFAVRNGILLLVAGYSGTALATKLGIGVGATLVLLRATEAANATDQLLSELPSGVIVKRQTRGGADVVLAFFRSLAKVEQRKESLASTIFPAGGLWIAWPKKTSGLPTDINDHRVRDVALPLGLVDNKVCAVDDTWTALRFVWRSELRRPETSPGHLRTSASC